jgi:hypothetical protein
MCRPGSACAARACSGREPSRGAGLIALLSRFLPSRQIAQIDRLRIRISRSTLILILQDSIFLTRAVSISLWLLSCVSPVLSLSHVSCLVEYIAVPSVWVSDTFYRFLPSRQIAQIDIFLQLFLHHLVSLHQHNTLQCMNLVAHEEKGPTLSPVSAVSPALTFACSPAIPPLSPSTPPPSTRGLRTTTELPRTATTLYLSTGQISSLHPSPSPSADTPTSLSSLYGESMAPRSMLSGNLSVPRLLN